MAAVDRLRSFYEDQLITRTGTGTLASIKSFGSQASMVASVASGNEGGGVEAKLRPGDEDVVIDPYTLDPDASSSSDGDDSHDNLSRPESGSGRSESEGDPDRDPDRVETEWESASEGEGEAATGAGRGEGDVGGGAGTQSAAAMSARTARSRAAGPPAPASVAAPASNWGGRSRRSIATTARTAASASVRMQAPGAAGLDARLTGRAVQRRLLRRRGWNFELQPDEVDYTLGRELPNVLTRPQPTADSDDEGEEEDEGGGGEEGEEAEGQVAGPPPGPVLESIKSYAHERAPEVLWAERLRQGKRQARATGQAVTVRGRMDLRKRKELARKIQKWDNREWFENRKRTPPAPPLHPAVARVIEQWFQLVDDDGGGTLDQEELMTALTASNVPVSAENIDEMIQLMDLDGDGVIAWKEFETFFMYEFAAGKNLLSGEYVLPSGVALPFGAMIAKLKRDKLLGDLMQGGKARAKWQTIADSPIALEDELGMMAAVEMAMEEMKNPAIGRARARAAKALSKLPPHLRTTSMARHLERHPEISDKMLRAPSMGAMLVNSMRRMPSTTSAMVARLASSGSVGSVSSSIGPSGGGAGASGSGGGRAGNVDLNVAAAQAAGLEWPVEGASFYTKSAKTVLRAACHKPPEAVLRSQQAAAAGATGAAVVAMGGAQRAATSNRRASIGRNNSTGNLLSRGIVEAAAAAAAADGADGDGDDDDGGIGRGGGGGGGLGTTAGGTCSSLAGMGATSTVSRIIMGRGRGRTAGGLGSGGGNSDSSGGEGSGEGGGGGGDGAEEDDAASSDGGDVLPWLVNAKRREEEERQELRAQLGMGGGSPAAQARGRRRSGHSARSGPSEGGEDEDGLWVSPLLRRWLTQQRSQKPQGAAEVEAEGEGAGGAGKPGCLSGTLAAAAAPAAEMYDTAAVAADDNGHAAARPPQPPPLLPPSPLAVDTWAAAAAAEAALQVEVTPPPAAVGSSLSATGEPVSAEPSGFYSLAGPSSTQLPMGAADTPGGGGGGEAARKPRRRMRFVDEEQVPAPTDDDAAPVADGGAPPAEAWALSVASADATPITATAALGVFLGSLGPHASPFNLGAGALAAAGEGPLEATDRPEEPISAHASRRSALLQSPSHHMASSAAEPLPPSGAAPPVHSPRGALRSGRAGSALGFGVQERSESPTGAHAGPPPPPPPLHSSTAAASPLRQSHGALASYGEDAEDARDMEPLDQEEARELMAGMTLQLDKGDAMYDMHTGHQADRPTTSDFRAALARMRTAAAALVQSYSLPPHPEYSGHLLSPQLSQLQLQPPHPQLPQPLRLESPSSIPVATQPSVESVGMAGALTSVAAAPPLPTDRPRGVCHAGGAGSGPAAGSGTARSRGKRTASQQVVTQAPGLLVSGLSVATSQHPASVAAASAAAPVLPAGCPSSLFASASAACLYPPHPQAQQQQRSASPLSRSPTHSYSEGGSISLEPSQPSDNHCAFGNAVYGCGSSIATAAIPTSLSTGRNSPDPGIVASAIANARQSRLGISRPPSRSLTPVQPYQQHQQQLQCSRPGSRLDLPSPSLMHHPAAQLLQQPQQQQQQQQSWASPPLPLSHAAAPAAAHSAAVAAAAAADARRKSHSVGHGALGPPPPPAAAEAWDARVAAILQRHTAAELASAQRPGAGARTSPGRPSTPDGSSGGGGAATRGTRPAMALLISRLTGGGGGDGGGRSDSGPSLLPSRAKSSMGLLWPEGQSEYGCGTEWDPLVGIGSASGPMPEFIALAGAMPRLQSRYAAKRPQPPLPPVPQTEDSEAPAAPVAAVAAAAPRAAGVGGCDGKGGEDTVSSSRGGYRLPDPWVEAGRAGGDAGWADGGLGSPGEVAAARLLARADGEESEESKEGDGGSTGVAVATGVGEYNGGEYDGSYDVDGGGASGIRVSAWGGDLDVDAEAALAARATAEAEAAEAGADGCGSGSADPAAAAIAGANIADDESLQATASYMSYATEGLLYDASRPSSSVRHHPVLPPLAPAPTDAAAGCAGGCGTGETQATARTELEMEAGANRVSRVVDGGGADWQRQPRTGLLQEAVHGSGSSRRLLLLQRSAASREDGTQAELEWQEEEPEEEEGVPGSHGTQTVFSGDGGKGAAEERGHEVEALAGREQEQELLEEQGEKDGGAPVWGAPAATPFDKPSTPALARLEPHKRGSGTDDAIGSRPRFGDAAAACFSSPALACFPAADLVATMLLPPSPLPLPILSVPPAPLPAVPPLSLHAAAMSSCGGGGPGLLSPYSGGVAAAGGHVLPNPSRLKAPAGLAAHQVPKLPSPLPSHHLQQSQQLLAPVPSQQQQQQQQDLSTLLPAPNGSPPAGSSPFLPSPLNGGNGAQSCRLISDLAGLVALGRGGGSSAPGMAATLAIAAAAAGRAAPSQGISHACFAAAAGEGVATTLYLPVAAQGPQQLRTRSYARSHHHHMQHQLTLPPLLREPTSPGGLTAPDVASTAIADSNHHRQNGGSLELETHDGGRGNRLCGPAAGTGGGAGGMGRSPSVSESLPALPLRGLPHEGERDGAALLPPQFPGGGNGVAAAGGVAVTGHPKGGSTGGTRGKLQLRALSGGSAPQPFLSFHHGGAGRQQQHAQHSRRAAWGDGSATARASIAPAPPSVGPLASAVFGSSLEELPDIVALLSNDPPAPLRTGPVRVKKIDY